MTGSKNQLLKITLISTMLAGACNNQPAQVQADAPVAYTQGTFGYDLDFLKQHDSVIVLRSDEGKAKVIVSAKYQGKVFTSTAEGNSGQSFGWIHYKAFAAAVDSHMNAYGGENRLWLGPEGGKFSLFFDKDAKMSFQNWRTPAAFDTEPWKITRQDSGSVSMEKDMKLVNYAGTLLSLTIGRNVAILDRQAINSLLNLTGDTAVKAVGYQTVNTLTNTGGQEWTEKTGMPCIWMLDMFNPSPATVIVVPYKEKATDKTGRTDKTAKADKVATTDYFGEIPADRIKYDQGVLLFRADGKSRGKLGLNPTRAKNIAGSYDALHKVLTLTLFDVDSTGKYLNQEWNTVKPSFSGDAVNAYNDGALADGSQMGPFYEIESVSPAAFLQPGHSLIHKHAVFHFTGDEAALDRISTQLLGVSLAIIKKAF
ncbi:DUF6786 family protein [Flavitalea flava]